jgi:Glycosyl transferases group 1
VAVGKALFRHSSLFQNAVIETHALLPEKFPVRLPSSSRKLRICVPIVTHSRKAFQCGLLEALDVLAEFADVDFVNLEPTKSFESRMSLLKRWLYHDITRKLAFANPGLRPVRLRKEYDLLVLVCPNWWDVLHINAIHGLRDRCRTSLCWIDELWAHSVPEYKYWLPLLRVFDHVVLGLNGSTRPVSDAIGKPCHYVPGGVDTLRFTPYPNPPKRSLDVYSIGRRWEGIHRTLVKFAKAKQLFYLFDTLQSGDSIVRDHREHRELYASVAKRSTFFMVAPPKIDLQKETGGQIEVPFRYYEGAAAGCVLIGQALQCQPFRRMFDWENAVIEVQPDGSDITEALSRLLAEPDLVAKISRTNAAEAMLRHDWVYRWKQILNIAGLDCHQAMEDREKRLRVLAGLATASLS